ncbi:Nucleotidyltransferase substrate binding protein, HI0074 family [Candidatus Magnetomoraceae bacterium gMMP-15]
MSNRFEDVFQDFTSALNKLQIAIDTAETDLEIDGAIQRFEFTFELFWKLLKVICFDEGIECKSPRGCLKMGFKLGFIKDEDIALQILDDRNKTAHVYDEDTSRKIFDCIKNTHFSFFNTVLTEIRSFFYLNDGVKSNDACKNASDM